MSKPIAIPNSYVTCSKCSKKYPKSKGHTCTVKIGKPSK